jgi:UDP-glucose 4-epimerase
LPNATLIVGAGGFIGRALTASLVSSGEPVIAGVRSAVKDLTPGAEHRLIDFDDRVSLQKMLERCGSVVYLASDSTPVSTAGLPLAEMDLNLRPLLIFLEELGKFQNIPLVYLSSAGSLYSGSDDQLLDEAQFPCPRSYHGAGKIAAEHFIGAWCRQNRTRATIIRPSNVFGPGQTERKGFGIIPSAFGAALRNEPITVRGDGEAARDYLYIDDLINLCTAIPREPPASGVAIFNAGTGVATPLKDLLTLIEDVTGRNLERHYQPIEAVDAETIAIDPSHAKDIFGWKAQMPLRRGLEVTWNWFCKRAQ